MTKKRTTVYARRARVAPAAVAGGVASEDAPERDQDRIRSNDTYRAIVRGVFGDRVHQMPAAMALDLSKATTADDLLRRARRYVPQHPALIPVLELWRVDPRPGRGPRGTPALDAARTQSASRPTAVVDEDATGPDEASDEQAALPAGPRHDR